MDIEKELKSLKDKISITQQLLENTIELYAECQDFTKDFLKKCKKYKINLVSIGTKCDEIEACKNWPFPYDHSIFADGDYKGWPAIWQVAKDCNLRGCGNRGQHQIPSTAKLIDGIYELKEGKWERRDC